jgi:fukutin
MKLRRITNQDNNHDLIVPFDYNSFIYDYEHSTFLECDQELAQEVLQKMGSSYAQDPKKNEKILSEAVYIRNFLEGKKINYLILGGSLIGWYRDCGIIPFTSDFDFGMPIHQYDESITKYFLQSQNVWLGYSFSLNETLTELTLFSKTFKYDLFLTMSHNSTHDFSYYYDNKKYLREIFLKVNSYCSGDILGEKFMIPCNGIELLDNQWFSNKTWRMPDKNVKINLLYNGTLDNNPIKYYNRDKKRN